MIWRRNLLLALLGLSTVVGIAALIHAEPAPPNAAPADSQPRQAAKAGLYRGTDNCERCHTAARPNDPAVPNHVLLNEAFLWRNEDKHALAYDHLREGLGQRIGERLNANVLDPSTGCIQCHTTSKQAGANNARTVNEHGEGVGCEACHGPSEHWVGRHNVVDEWQRESRDAKTADGWIDIRSPQARAEVCLSCHIGSPADGRVITHAMYAAGHPPLAGFEIETFADIMPRHWRHPYEKPNPPGKSFDRTRDILTASVVSLRTAIELALSDAAAPGGPERWPEFARLDCFACHHDVAQPGWRQNRIDAFSPGRPRLIVGCLPLVSVAARATHGKDADAKLSVLTQQLQAPFATNAFGDPGKIAEHGPSIVATCRDLERQLETNLLSPEAALDVLHAITHEATAEYHDFDTARQLFGAWSVVWQELVDNGVLPNSPEVGERITVANGVFNLNRPKPLDPSATELKQRSVSDELPALFDSRANYDAAKFADEMAALDALTTAPQAASN